MSARVFCLSDLRGAFLLCVLAKRSYRFEAGRLVPAGDAPPVQEEPFYVPSTNADALERLEADSDLLCPLKSSTDVLVRGEAFSTRGPVRMLDTHVQIGALEKTVRVWGRRSIQVHADGRLSFSQPEPFTSAPLTWDEAYGGRDTAAEERGGSSRRWGREQEPAGMVVYPRNPSGRGFFLDFDRDRLDGAEAARLEDPSDPITAGQLLATDALDWLDRPLPACYAPVDWWMFPRLSFWLGAEHRPPTRPLHERLLGIISERSIADRRLGAGLDVRAFNCAPSGLSGVRLTGRERMRLRHLHPSRERVEVDLPGDVPRLFLEPPGCRVYELPAVLATVLVEPAAERVTLIWTGSLEVAAPFSLEVCARMRRAARWGA
jgi:hypothetical protein